MKIVKIKMLKNFRDDHCSVVLHEGETYFAIDGGDYWLVQRYSDTGFIRVVPKGSKRITPTPYAEVVPTHTDEASSCQGCSVGLHKPDGE